jgi:hypothetical protein
MEKGLGNFWTDILNATNGEPIQSGVIGNFGWDRLYDSDSRVPQDQKTKLLTRDELSKLLNYEYDAGYGAPDCHAVTIWTTAHVLFIVQYDGATNVHSVPRNPVPHIPEMPGGCGC